MHWFLLLLCGACVIAALSLRYKTRARVSRFSTSISAAPTPRVLVVRRRVRIRERPLISATIRLITFVVGVIGKGLRPILMLPRVLLTRAPWLRQTPWLACGTGFVVREEVEPILYHGDCSMLSQVYKDDSHNITVRLVPLFGAEDFGEVFQTEETESGASVKLKVERVPGTPQFLEVELLAAGIKVAGKTLQRHSILDPNLSFVWNCSFPTSGNHSIALVFRVVSDSKTVDLGTVEHSIKVVQVDGLTQRQVLLVVVALGGVSLISGILGIVKLGQEVGLF